MRERASREMRSGLNREQVLAAARRVFLVSGYERATLESIADEAGFSKGVVYSQFESKGDLFLALLDRRIAERAAQNEAIAKRHPGLAGISALVRAARHDAEDESAWAHLLLEFRLHAARDPGLARRYGEAHRRTIAALAALIERAFDDAGETPVESPRQLAVLLVALGPGVQLERSFEGRALPHGVIDRAFERLFGIAK